MNLLSLLSNIRWLPVAVVTIISFALGAFWHSPLLFGKIWAKEINRDDTQKVSIPLTFGGTAVAHFILIAGLSAVVSGSGIVTGTLSGLLISLVWVVPSLSGTYLFANRSLKLLSIDAGMYVILFSVSGLILGVW